ncbi:MAG: hypothetical protein IBJ01_00085 [Leptospira sp.]|uniref:hypothetical protein n=1 Tax=Leptospira sp. TaxID=178 RepID=UPI0025C342A4|nr:hypothetical protein [Leptospira sp.]MBL0953148.1 hypothetical protein [Leptospira sp.]
MYRIESFSFIPMKEFRIPFVFGISIYAILLFAFNGVPDADIFYHFAIAKLYLKEGFVSKLPWPEIAIQSKEFTDYHFLFHILQIPFLILPFEESIVIKLFILCSISVLLYTVLLYIHSKSPETSPYLIVTFFILGSILFTGRMLFGRGNLIFFSLYFLCLYHWHPKFIYRIFVISFLSVWTYSGFPYLIITATCIFFLDPNKDNFKILISIASGILFGLLCHPSFPHQFKGYFIELILQTMPPNGIEPIAEWLAPTRDIIILGFVFIFPLLLLSFKNLLQNKWEPTSIVFLFLGITNLIFAGSSMRVFEISWLMFFVFIFSNLKLSRNYQLAVTIFLFIIQFPIAYDKMGQQFKSSESKYGQIVTDWIRFNIPKGERIFLSWADYPYFTFKIPEYRFLFGLNPLYAWSYDQNSYFTQKAFFESNVQGFEMIPKVMNYNTVVINKQYYGYTAKSFRAISTDYFLTFENEKYAIFVRTETTQNNTRQNNINPK